MSAYYENPDAAVLEHGLNNEQLALARFVEEASLAYVKQVLERMGVTRITRTDTWQTMGPKLVKHRISIAHLTASEDPAQDGWWIRRGDRAEVHIAEPVPTDDMQLRFRTRYMA